MLLLAAIPPAEQSDAVDSVDELDAMLIFGDISEDTYIKARKRRAARGQ